MGTAAIIFEKGGTTAAGNFDPLSAGIRWMNLFIAPPQDIVEEAASKSSRAQE